MIGLWLTVPLVRSSTKFSGLSERSCWMTDEVTCNLSWFTRFGCGVHWCSLNDLDLTLTLQVGQSTVTSPSSCRIKLGAGLLEDGSSGVSEKQQGHWEDTEMVNQLVAQGAHTKDWQGNSSGWHKISKQTGHLRWSNADKVWISEICGRGGVMVFVGFDMLN